MHLLHSAGFVPLAAEQKVEVDGVIWERATGVSTFEGYPGAWSRVFYATTHGESHSLKPATSVRVVSDAASSAEAADVMRYLREIASHQPCDDPIRRVYDELGFLHPDSAFGRYLAGGTVEIRELTEPLIFPFRCNLSQHEAVERALTSSVSVIEGPPGTGKTETILNLIANILASGTATVGVVSYSNTAVDNVYEKLDDLGFGHVIARLGNSDRREEFFSDAQRERNERVTELVAAAPEPPAAAPMAGVCARLRGLQEAERERARLRQDVAAYVLEQRHFQRHVANDELPDLHRLPLLRRSSARILDYLAETSALGEDHLGPWRRIRRYLRYGSLSGLNPADTGTVLALQQAFYDRRIAELTARLDTLDEMLRRADLDGLAEEYRGLSVQSLHAALAVRYRTRSRSSYRAESYRRAENFARFVVDYPVVLSTCHSLRRSIQPGYLLDYLIIDEASMVDLLAAGAAMSCARNLVVVGDLKQLPHIPGDVRRDLAAPTEMFDYQRHSILSSLTEWSGGDLPRTLLREHYRCDPAIIGFCNRAFYDGELIPYTRRGDEPAMFVWATPEGNHERQHRDGGRSNQREVDVIVKEVIPTHGVGVSRADIGVTTPYRRQADKATAAFVDAVEKIDADTVHKFQGRQKRVMVMTTVLSETWRGRTGLRFVDDPQLINVAVSRAAAKFVLVTNHELLPTSRYLRDLIDYISYQSLDSDVTRSRVISVFDLLYREYSARLRPLAERLRNDLAYRSENIIWTVLNDVLVEPKYEHLTVTPQVLLRNLLPDAHRLSPRQAAFVRNRASVDFVVYNRVSNRAVLAIEVDGFRHHEDDPDQRQRDVIKNDILKRYGVRLLRLPTTGSAEPSTIRAELDRARLLGLRPTTG
ncbi:MAG: AAA domain-containing protein [Dermatophilaceae bacterium]